MIPWISVLLGRYSLPLQGKMDISFHSLFFIIYYSFPMNFKQAPRTAN